MNTPITRRLRGVVLPCILGLLAATAAQAAPAPAGPAHAAPAHAAPAHTGSAAPPHPSSADATREPPAVLHFADLDGIRDWRALRENRLLIEGSNHTFYVATFWGLCTDLRNAETVGFVTDPSGNLTRFDSIVVRGHQCHFRSLERISRDAAAGLR